MAPRRRRTAHAARLLPIRPGFTTPHPYRHEPTCAFVCLHFLSIRSPIGALRPDLFVHFLCTFCAGLPGIVLNTPSHPSLAGLFVLFVHHFVDPPGLRRPPYLIRAATAPLTRLTSHQHPLSFAFESLPPDGAHPNHTVRRRPQNGRDRTTHRDRPRPAIPSRRGRSKQRPYNQF